MDDEKCSFCLNRWGCHGECTQCEKSNCGYNHNGHCLDVKALKHPEKQTGCIWFNGRKTDKVKE